MKNKYVKKENKNPRNYLLIGIFIIVLIATNTSLYIGLRDKKVGNLLSQFTLLNPARAFHKQDNLIVNFQPLRDYLNKTYEKDSNVSIYFEYLPTGANISLGKNAEFFPASLFKLPVAMAVAKKIEKGEWKWDDKLVLMSTDKDTKYGTLYNEPTGSTFTIEELVKRSLVESDNTAHYILLRNLEISEINEVYNHVGLLNFLDTGGNISAKHYSVILRALYNASYVDEDNSQKLISYLSQADFKEYLSTGIQENTVFAHKIGIDVNKGIYMDAGIAYVTGRPYLLVVMTKSKTEEVAKAIMKDISEKIFNYVTNYYEENN